MREQYDIVIVGAGLMGATLALWLVENTSYTVALLERGRPLDAATPSNQRVVALGAKATGLLSDLGVFDALNKQSAYSYTRMTVWDEQSNGELNFSADDTPLPQLGHMVDSLRCNYLLQQACLVHQGLDCLFSASIESLENGQSLTGITLIDGNGSTRLVASLLVAADGAGSWVRQQAGIFSNHRDYQQIGIVACVEPSQSHDDCAWQRFLSSGPVAFLPLAGNQCSIVWSVDQQLGSELMALSELDFEIALAQAIEQRLGRVKLRSPRYAFPLKSQRAERYYRNNIVLLGDAAHAIHPLAGQGANLGFQDVLCLGNLLKDAGRDQLSDGAVLSRYQMRRQRDNEQADGVMTALHTAYQHNAPIWTTLRGFGMNWIDGNQAVRRVLIRQAMGL